jgi:hypothetical protein
MSHLQLGQGCATGTAKTPDFIGFVPVSQYVPAFLVRTREDVLSELSKASGTTGTLGRRRWWRWPVLAPSAQPWGAYRISVPELQRCRTVLGVTIAPAIA